MYTDSKYWIYQFSNRNNMKKAWVKVQNKPLKYVPKDKKQIHAYGGITYYGLTDLVMVSGTSQYDSPFRSTRSKRSKGCGAYEYCQVLKQKLLPQAREIFKDK